MVTLIEIKQQIQNKQELLVKKQKELDEPVLARERIYCTELEEEIDLLHMRFNSSDNIQQKQDIDASIHILELDLKDSKQRIVEYEKMPQEVEQLMKKRLKQTIEELKQEINELTRKLIAASISSQYRVSLPVDKQSSFFSQPPKKVLDTANELCTKIIDSIQLDKLGAYPQM